LKTRILTAILLTFLACIPLALAEESPQSQGRVTLPLAEFLKRTEPAPSPSGTTRPTAPIPFSLARGQYRIVVQGDWARVQADLGVRVLSGGFQEIPLLPADVVLQEARLDGKPVSVFPKDSVNFFVVRGIGTHRLELVYHLPIQDESPSRSLDIVVPDTAISTWTLSVPGNQVHLKSTPEIPLQSHPEGQRTVARGTLPAGASPPVRLSWLSLKADPETRGLVTREAPRLYGRVYQLVRVSEKAIQNRARIDFSILRNEVSQLQLLLPRDAEVLAVECPDLDSWRTVERPQGRLLTVLLSQPKSGELSLEVTTETPLAETNSCWTLPYLYLEGAERVKGSIGLCSSGALELLPRDDLQEARRIDVQQDLPAQIHALASSPILLAYEYHRQPYRVQIESRKGEEVAVLDATIDSARGRTLLTEEGKALSVFTWQVRNNSRQGLLLALAEGSEVWSAFVDGRPARPTQEPDGRVRIPLALSPGRGGEMATFPVVLTWVRRAGGEGPVAWTRLQAPRVDIPISEMTWQVDLPEDRQVLYLDGTMEPLTPAHRRGSSFSRLIGRSMDASAPVSSKEVGDEGRAGPDPQASLARERVRGVFPVQVHVPQVGQPLNFSRLMVSGEEAPSIGIFTASRSLAASFGWLLFALVLMAGAFRLADPSSWKALAWGWVLLILGEILLGGTWLDQALTGLARALWLLSVLWLMLRVRYLGAWWRQRRVPAGEADDRPEIPDEARLETPVEGPNPTPGSETEDPSPKAPDPTRED
jgi:hypothetical protein